MTQKLPSKESNSRGVLGSKLLASVRQMNARNFERVTQVATNPVDQVSELNVLPQQATAQDCEVEFAKARLESYLKDPQNTIPWSTIREESGC